MGNPKYLVSVGLNSPCLNSEGLVSLLVFIPGFITNRTALFWSCIIKFAFARCLVMILNSY